MFRATIKAILKQVAHAILKDYSLAVVYSLQLEQCAKRPTHEDGREVRISLRSKSASGRELSCDLVHSGIKAARCTVSIGDAAHDVALQPLPNNEALLHSLETDPAHRKQGHAKALIERIAIELGSTRPIKRMYAVVWHSNLASHRTLQSAGWAAEYRFLKIQLKGLPASMSLNLKRPIK